jgi:predicted RNase H-like nuclease (RuvC/YqgF family)
MSLYDHPICRTDKNRAAKWKMIVENPIQQLEAHLAKLFTDKFNELQIQILPPKPEEEEVEIQPHRFANIEIEIRAQKDHIQAKHKEALELEEKLSQLEAKHKRLLEELNQLEPKVEKLQKECPKLIAQNQHIEAKINLRFQQLNQLAPEAERLRIQQGLLLTRYDQINKLFKVHKKLRMESYSYTAPFNPYSNDFGTSASHNSSELKAAGRSYQTGSHASSSDWSSFNTPDFTQAQSFSGVADSSQHPGVMR